MFKTDHRKAQAAVELAVFGAVLIFLLGTIVRSAVSDSYEQDENFKAMRMALLASWNESKSNPGLGASQITGHNSATILFIEDRLSPDVNKYGDLDRIPYISMGSGTMSYNLLYPLNQSSDVQASVPTMDVYINGVHFPFTTGAYVSNRVLTPPTCPPGGGPNQPGGPYEYTNLSNAQCVQNQCLRDQRSWVGGVVYISNFSQGSAGPTVAPTTPTGNCLTAGTAAQERECQEQNNACQIFTDLSTAQIFPTPAPAQCLGTETAVISPSVLPLPTNASDTTNSYWNGFVQLYESSFPNPGSYTYGYYLKNILSILSANASGYKLLYTMTPNPGPTAGTSQFSPTPPTQSCSSPPCADQALTANLVTADANGNMGYWNGIDPTCNSKSSDYNAQSSPTCNHTGDMMYDLLRNADYSANSPAGAPNGGYTTGGVEYQFGVPGSAVCASNGIGGTGAAMMRCYIGWQWAASAGTSASAIGLNTSNGTYPTYDIDGRLKEVTVYGIGSTSSPPSVTISYLDSQAGDIDLTWDTNSCGPKAGLQNTAQVLTYTSAPCTGGDACPSSGVCSDGTTCGGTYLLINEGKLYNPETGQVVRSANKRDNVDLIQRTFQLSNNTGRFCTATSPPSPLACVANNCTEYPYNPVEVCVDGTGCPNGPSCSCNSTEQNIKSTCYDLSQNLIFVRSRLQDQRGRFWMTNATGQLQVGRQQ